MFPQAVGEAHYGSNEAKRKAKTAPKTHIYMQPSISIRDQ
jgi:hypothetical protein